MAEDPTTSSAPSADHPAAPSVDGGRPAARLPRLALGLLSLCVLALAVGPIITASELSAVRDRSEGTTVAAASRLDSLRLLVAEQVIEHLHSRIAPEVLHESPFAAYRRYRASEARVRTELRALATKVGGDVPNAFHALEVALDRWHETPDARADGRLSETRFAELVPLTRARRDTMLQAHARVAAAIRRIEASNRAEGARAIDRQYTFSALLGALAVLSLGLLVWLARGERALARELTNAVREEARLRALAERRREDLAKVSQSKSRLVRGFTHDVKNPIGAADGYLQLLEDGIAGPLAEKQGAYIGRARRGIRSALGLIGDLLEVERVESGHLTVQRIRTDVRAIACEVADEFRAQAEGKGLAMHVEVPDETPSVDTDAARVRQVIGNLVSNAVKYTPAGSVTVRVLVRPARRADDRGPWLAVEVEDTGPGIPEEKRRLLFQEFTRLDPTAAPGVGIGLAMACRITEALGGDLSVRSEVGRGSTFVLALPTAMPADDPAAT